MPLGPTSLLVVVEVDFADEISASEVERASDRLRNAVAAAVGEAGDPRLVVVDPRARARARRAIA